jgi:hypothetical protein
MRTVRIVEFIAGWLAVVIGVAVTVFSYLGGFIAPFAVTSDLIGCAVILATIALGVTLESLTGSLVARIILGLGTLAWLLAVVSSFLVFLLPSGALAVAATLIAFTRHLPAPAPRQLDV